MTHHKSLKAWQEAHLLANSALDARDHWQPYLAPVYSQLTRAALSVQINISEGYAFGSDSRFIHHLKIAKGSAAEAGDLFDLLLERKEVPDDAGSLAVQWSARCQALIYGLLKSLVSAVER